MRVVRCQVDAVYAFYNLPYCAPHDIEIKREDLGPLLKGDRPTKTLYEIKFKGVPSLSLPVRPHLPDFATGAYC